jgi:hypothetical protein
MPPWCLPAAQSARIHAQRLKLSNLGSLEPDNSNTFVSSPPDAGFSNTRLNLRFDVLVQAKEVLRVVLLLDGHEPVVVEPERGFNRVFSLLT